MYENIVCGDCGEPNRFDCVIPSEVWNACCADADILCFRCIDRRVKAAGLSCECEFYAVGEAVKSKLYGEAAWQPIETAPKTADDFSTGAIEILAHIPSDGRNGYDREVVWWEPKLNDGKGCWWFSGDYEVKPTFWQPLPQPPTPPAASPPAAVYCAPCGKEHGGPPCQPV